MLLARENGIPLGPLSLSDSKLLAMLRFQTTGLIETQVHGGRLRLSFARVLLEKRFYISFLLALFPKSGVRS